MDELTPRVEALRAAVETRGTTLGRRWALRLAVPVVQALVLLTIPALAWGLVRSADESPSQTAPPPPPSMSEPEPIAVAEPPPEPIAMEAPQPVPMTKPVCRSGAADCPMPLGLPARVRGDTRGFPGLVAAWSCAPDRPEGGPEVWYALDVPRAGILSLQIEERGGVDVDVHLLTGPSADACVARAHRTLVHRVEAGQHWVVVDTWSGGDRSRPGTYALSAKLE